MKAYVVDTAALEQNIRNLRQKAGDAAFWAVLKGNGYGLGLLPMAHVCHDAGVDRFAVTEVKDVQKLREGGFATESVLMLRPTTDSDEIQSLLDYGAVFTVSSEEDAVVLNGLAAQRNLSAEVHIKIDTGMGRYGFLPTELDKVLRIYSYMDKLRVTGIYTHFHSAFCSKKDTQAQYEAFQSVLNTIRAAGFEPGMAHICNSAGLLRFPDYRLDGVRIGSALLGRLSCKGSWGLKRIGQLEATVDELRWIPKGHTCGYGAGWKARKRTRIAVLPVGWYHGFSCEMGNDLFRFRDCLRGVLKNIKRMIFRKSLYVQLGGKKCRVLGHVGMLHTVVDVTNITCSLGDKAVLDVNPIMLKGVDVIFQ